MRRLVAFAVTALLLLPGVLAALPSCAPEGEGCAPPAGAHDCCPPAPASLLAGCCVARGEAVPGPAPTAPQRQAAPAAAPVAAATLPPPVLLALTAPAACAPLPLARGERHTVLRR